MLLRLYVRKCPFTLKRITSGEYWWEWYSINAGIGKSSVWTNHNKEPLQEVPQVWHFNNKKVLLRERKRHTTRKRVQDADPPRLDLPPPGQLDLKPPPVGWLTWPPPPSWLDLTPPSADWPDPPLPAGPDPPQLSGWPAPPLAGWTWPPLPAGPDPPPLAGPDPPPPRCGQSENITFPILRMRAVKIMVLSVSHLS